MADFDLTQSFPKLSLMDKKQQTIKEIFGESERENIIVKELWLFCSYIFDLFFFLFLKIKLSSIPSLEKMTLLKTKTYET